MSFFGVILAGISPLIRRGNARRIALVFLGLHATFVGAIYFIYQHFYLALSIPVLGGMLLNLIELFFPASLGLSMAVAAATEGLLDNARKNRKRLHVSVCITVILLVVSDGLPWFNLQASGKPSPNALARDAFGSWSVAMPGL